MGETRIFVLQRGWVVVGKIVELACKGDEGALAITEWFAEKEGL